MSTNSVEACIHAVCPAQDGRVRYKEFCDLMESAYNEPELEKKPTTTVVRPLRGHLSRVSRVRDISLT